jgi:hypothetical protein
VEFVERARWFVIMVSELFGAGKNISDEKRSHFDY